MNAHDLQAQSRSVINAQHLPQPPHVIKPQAAAVAAAQHQPCRPCPHVLQIKSNCITANRQAPVCLVLQTALDSSPSASQGLVCQNIKRGDMPEGRCRNVDFLHHGSNCAVEHMRRHMACHHLPTKPALAYQPCKPWPEPPKVAQGRSITFTTQQTPQQACMPASCQTVTPPQPGTAAVTASELTSTPPPQHWSWHVHVLSSRRFCGCAAVEVKLAQWFWTRLQSMDMESHEKAPFDWSCVLRAATHYTRQHATGTGASNMSPGTSG